MVHVGGHDRPLPADHLEVIPARRLATSAPWAQPSAIVDDVTP